MSNKKNDAKFKDELLQKIPILKHNNLLDLVLQFGKARKVENIDDKKRAISSAIRKINGVVRQNVYNYESSVNKIGNKYVKSHELSAHGLLEAIVNCALHYFESSITVNSSMKISNNGNLLLQIMNNVKYMSLGYYISELYNRDNINEDEKNKLLLEILKKIAIKLEYLQSKYKFIHGDFHMNNIYISVNVSENGSLIVDIRFIDFGQTIITCNGIIFTPFEEFYGNKYGDKYKILKLYLYNSDNDHDYDYDYYYIKTLDLRYLIADISTKFKFAEKILKLSNNMFLPEIFKDITMEKLLIVNNKKLHKKNNVIMNISLDRKRKGIRLFSNNSPVKSPNSKGYSLFSNNIYNVK
jgi:hypothetical protein